MDPLYAILIFGSLMSLVALVGSVTLLLSEARLARLIPTLVAFASGALIGGALFHMIPSAVEKMGNTLQVYVWIAIGFIIFLVLEQLLHWHHCHRTPASHTCHARPTGVLMLIADGFHNLLGGLSIGALFVTDFNLGLAAWWAALAHEIPQELGDFGVLVHSGWKKSTALIFNVLSALPFLVGGLISYFISTKISIDFLIPLAAGNFLYIGAADLMPEFKETCDGRPNFQGTFAWLLGMLLLFSARYFE